jgi:hypothetical protein
VGCGNVVETLGKRSLEVKRARGFPIPASKRQSGSFAGLEDDRWVEDPGRKEREPVLVTELRRRELAHLGGRPKTHPECGIQKLDRDSTDPRTCFSDLRHRRLALSALLSLDLRPDTLGGCVTVRVPGTRGSSPSYRNPVWLQLRRRQP